MKTKRLILSKLFFGGLIAALIACCPLQTQANAIALSFTGGSLATAGANRTYGWEFTLSSPVTLTDLGLWDRFGGGLSQSHVVTVWTSTGTQEAQTTIPSGGGTLTNGFRYESILPVMLPAGTYTIGAYFDGGPDFFTVEASSVATAAGVTFDSASVGTGNGIPGNNPAAGNSYFGPNFQFTSVSDSGSTWALLLFGVTATFRLNLLLHRRSEA